MLTKKYQKNIIYSFALLLGLFLIFNKAEAAGMSVGSDTLTLGSGENIYYGLTSSSNANGNFLLFQKGGGNTVFKIDYNGNITTNGSVLGTNNYFNLSGNNLYASSTAWNLGIGTTNPGAKLNVNGDVIFNYRDLTLIGDANGATARWAKFATITTVNGWENNRYEYYIKSRDYEGTLRVHIGTAATATASSIVWFQYDRDFGGIGERFAIYQSTPGTYDIYTYIPGYHSVYYSQLYNNQSGNGWNGTAAVTYYSGTYSDPPAGYSEVSYDKNFLGNIGIGTTAPASALQINNATGFINNGVTKLSALGAAGNVIVMADNNGTLYTSPAGSSLLWSGSTTGNIWNANTGNVGIGTTSPGGTLTVLGSGTQYVYGDIYNARSGSYYGGNWPSAGTWLLGGGDASSNVYLKSSGGGIANLIVSNGSIGIGTTNPVAALSFANSVGQKISFYDSAGTDRYGLDVQSSELRIYSGAAGASTGGITFGKSNGTTFTEAMRIRNDGNVGIGTTASASKLQINGTTGFINNGTTQLSALGAAGNVLVMADNSGNLYGTAKLWSGTISGNIWNNNSGNVGIGTPSPANQLSLLANANLVGSSVTGLSVTNSNSAGYANTILYNDTGDFGQFLLTGSTGAISGTDIMARQAALLSSATNGLNFYTSSGPIYFTPGGGGTAKVVMLANGSVGIGTTAPGVKLEIGSGSTLRTPSATVSGLGSAGNVVVMADNSGNLYSGPSAGSSLLWSGSTTGNIWNANTGNIGIGTTNPGMLFQVRSDGLGTWGGRMGLANATADKEVFLGTYGSNAGVFVHNNALSAWAPLYVNTVDANNGGNVIMSGPVGIGTTIPGAQLDVTGGAFRTPSAAVSGLGGAGNVMVMADNSGNLYSTSTSAVFSFGAMNSNLNMNFHDIQNVTKLTVQTIDPLYTINGSKYSTYAASIAGGVKEEYVGHLKIDDLNIVNGQKVYEKELDFDKIKEGDDLWVWRKVVDFNKDNIEVLITPYGGFANSYYIINKNKIIFYSSSSAEISYRLIGRRIDWHKWPTKQLNETESGIIIN